MNTFSSAPNIIVAVNPEANYSTIFAARHNNLLWINNGALYIKRKDYILFVVTRPLIFSNRNVCNTFYLGPILVMLLILWKVPRYIFFTCTTPSLSTYIWIICTFYKRRRFLVLRRFYVRVYTLILYTKYARINTFK